MYVFNQKYILVETSKLNFMATGSYRLYALVPVILRCIVWGEFKTIDDGSTDRFLFLNIFVVASSPVFPRFVGLAN